MSMSEIKVSVIIPVFKTEKERIDKCIQSIIEQDFKNYEVLIVDDGNDKEYADMLDSLCKDVRIHVVHKENGGASSARNAGLERACGEYVAFVDSDDTITGNFLSQAVEGLDKYNLDIVMGGYHVGDILHMPDCEEIKIYDKEQIKYLKELFVAGFGTDNTKELRNCLGLVAPWAKMFRRCKIKDILFDEQLILSEDTLYNLYCMEQVERIGIIPECWYNYFVVENSICHSYRTNARNEIDMSTKKFCEYIASSKEGKKFFEEALQYRMLRQLNNLLEYHYCNNGYDGKNPVKGIKSYLKDSKFPKVKSKNKFYISKGIYVLRLLSNHGCAAGIYYFYKLKKSLKK